MATREAIQRAGEALAEAAGKRSRVILFGSHARGEERADSDVDFLVIEPEVEDRFGETVRLGDLIGRLGVPADVVVVSEDQVREWGELSGTMLHDALAEGQVLAGRAS
jgi:predicted nucleotidyltransferase